MPPYPNKLIGRPKGPMFERHIGVVFHPGDPKLSYPSRFNLQQLRYDRLLMLFLGEPAMIETWT